MTANITNSIEQAVWNSIKDNLVEASTNKTLTEITDSKRMDTLVDNIVHKENDVTKMKSTKYTANAKILDNKIMKRRLNKDPPDNLHLNKIATTLYSETSKYEDNDDARVDKFGYALTRSGNGYLPDPLPSRQITPTPPTSCSRQRPNNRTQRRGQSNSYNNFCTIELCHHKYDMYHLQPNQQLLYDKNLRNENGLHNDKNEMNHVQTSWFWLQTTETTPATKCMIPTTVMKITTKYS